MSNANEATVDDGGSAFPCEGGVTSALIPDPGMSLRDWFAGQALVAIIFADGIQYVEGDADIHARMAYASADAMLRARRPTPSA